MLSDECGEQRAVLAIDRGCCDLQSMRCGLWAGLAGEDLHAVRAVGRRYALRRGQAVADVTGAGTYCANLTTGILQVLRPEVDGSRTIGLVFPGEIIGDLNGGRPSDDAIVAITDAEICIYQSVDLERVADRHPSVRRALLGSAFEALSQARRWMLVLSRPSARERVAAFLVEMAGRLRGVNADQNTLELGLSRGRIGDLLGLSLETTSRQMQALARAGLIAFPQRRQVRFVNRGGLEKVAGLAFRPPTGAAV